VVAIGTEGAAPVLGRQVRTRLEEVLEPRLGAFTALAGRLRAAVAQRVPRERRRAFWDWAFGAPRRRFTGGDEAGAEAELRAAIEAGGPPGPGAGRVALIDPGTGEADLLTLRAVARLQSADLVRHGPEVPAAILELARRDAEREAVAPARPADALAARIAGEAREGLEVVILGLPALAARLAAHGVEAEAVPAASPAREPSIGAARPGPRGRGSPPPGGRAGEAVASGPPGPGRQP
jgi:uroporphyrin-III C-methyltransferase/precorrin-2 dehydrogenase/sirohydrochlorin ferrochelatase